MPAIPSPKLLELLRSTLEKMETDPDIPRDHPAAVELRRSITRSIAELEVQRTTEAAA